MKPLDLPLLEHDPFDHRLIEDPVPWESSETIVLTDTVTGDSCTNRTTVSLINSGDQLFVRFICLSPKIHATYQDHNDPVWEEEAVEVFLQPPGLTNYYYEMDLNPLNAFTELFVINNEMAGEQR